MRRSREARSHADIEESVRRAQAQRREYLHGVFNAALEGIVRGIASLAARWRKGRPLAAH